MICFWAEWGSLNPQAHDLPKVEGSFTYKKMSATGWTQWQTPLIPDLGNQSRHSLGMLCQSDLHSKLQASQGNTEGIFLKKKGGKKSMVFLSLSISPRTTVSSSIHLPANLFLCNRWLIFYCVNLSHFHYPFISWCIPSLFQISVYYE